MIDIDIKCNEGRFKLRASGIIIKNNKLLVQKSRKFDGYILPGGHIELGESSKEAIIREIKEETGFNVKIKKLMCINENIYQETEDKICHEINYYYTLKILDDFEIKDYTLIENDKGKIIEQKLFWIDIDKLTEKNLIPNTISKLIESNKDIENLILETIDTK